MMMWIMGIMTSRVYCCIIQSLAVSLRGWKLAHIGCQNITGPIYPMALMGVE